MFASGNGKERSPEWVWKEFLLFAAKGSPFFLFFSSSCPELVQTRN
jgi:hypothetical protein